VLIFLGAFFGDVSENQIVYGLCSSVLPVAGYLVKVHYLPGVGYLVKVHCVSTVVACVVVV
jgi:hypothetical protein